MKPDSILQQARNEVAQEESNACRIPIHAKEELKSLFRERNKAQKVVDAIDHKIELAEAKLS